MRAVAVSLVFVLLSWSLCVLGSPGAATTAPPQQGGQQNAGSSSRQQQVKQAEQPPQPSVAYEGSAFLMGYYAGVTQALLDNKVLVPGVTPSGGLSGGAYTLSLAHLGWNGSRILGFWKDVILVKGARLAESHEIVGRLNAVAGWGLAESLPDKPQDTLNKCMRIAISQLDASKRSLNDSAAWVVDHWDNRADVMSSLLATSYLSCFSGPTPYTIFRNQPAMDGGYSSGFKQLCPGGDTSNCIKVASWVVGPLANSTCDAAKCGSASAAADCKTDDRTNIITKLYKNGPYVDRWPLAEVQLRCPPPPATTWAGLAPYPAPAFVPQNSVAPDIFPGRFNALPEWPPGSGTRLLACQWQNFAMSPPQGQLAEFLEVSYQLGFDDAAAWVSWRSAQRTASAGR